MTYGHSFSFAPLGGCFCKVMILLGLPSTITKKLLKIKELGVFWGGFCSIMDQFQTIGRVVEPVWSVSF